MVQVDVVFTHDDSAKKWECVVRGARTELEARQAFTAVVLSCQMIDGALQLRKCLVKPVENGFAITPAVTTVAHFPVSYAFTLHKGGGFLYLCLDCKDKADRDIVDVSKYVKDSPEAGTKVTCDGCGKRTILTD